MGRGYNVGEIYKVKLTPEDIGNKMTKWHHIREKYYPGKVVPVTPQEQGELVNTVNYLLDELEKRDEVLTYIDLILSKHQTWTGQGYVQNHIADFEARKILAKIHEVRKDE